MDFSVPTTGLTLNFSSLASPNFATFYALSNTGTLDGSVSYLYSSFPLHITAKSGDLPLQRVVPGYRQLRDLRESYQQRVGEQTFSEHKYPTLLYGRLYLPTSHLEALYLRRLSPTTQLKISGVSSSQLRSGGSILFLLSRDYGKYSTEWLYSTDSALLGVRGLYNFGPDPRQPDDSLTPTQGDAILTSLPPTAATSLRKGRFSAGAEIYYGILNKSGGMSTGLRFATLPQHTGFPYTMTLTVNPLMGNLSAAYAVRAGSTLALCSRFNFNFYSYESDFQLGVELWRRKPQTSDHLAWARSKLREPGRAGWGEPRLAAADVAYAMSDAGDGMSGDNGSLVDLAPIEVPQKPILDLSADNISLAPEQTAGVLKARINQDGGVALLWEGKLKDLLCSAGVTVDFKHREQIFRGVGLEMSYSS